MPAILTPVNADASKLSARRSSGSRLCTDDLPQALARAVTSMVIAVSIRATRSAPAATFIRSPAPCGCDRMHGRRLLIAQMKKPGPA